VLTYLIYRFKGTVSRDFRTSVFFHQSTPPRALIHRLKPFRILLLIRRENRFGIRQNRLRPQKTTFFYWWSPLIFTFSSNYKYVMFTYCMYLFCRGIPSKELRANNRFHKGFRSFIKNSAVSLRLLNPLQRSH
jgi:hypothetical protein